MEPKISFRIKTSKTRADEDNDDVIESFSLYYIFSVFPSFISSKIIMLGDC